MFRVLGVVADRLLERLYPLEERAKAFLMTTQDRIDATPNHPAVRAASRRNADEAHTTQTSGLGGQQERNSK